jgi:hypothetical protein
LEIFKKFKNTESAYDKAGADKNQVLVTSKGTKNY